MASSPETGPAQQLLAKLQQLFPEPDFYISGSSHHNSRMATSPLGQYEDELNADFVLYSENFEVITAIKLGSSATKTKISPTSNPMGYRIEHVGHYWQNISDENLKAWLLTGKKVALQKRATARTSSIAPIEGANPKPVSVYALAALALVLLAVQIPWSGVLGFSKQSPMTTTRKVESDPAKLSGRTKAENSPTISNESHQ